MGQEKKKKWNSLGWARFKSTVSAKDSRFSVPDAVTHDAFLCVEVVCAHFFWKPNKKCNALSLASETVSLVVHDSSVFCQNWCMNMKEDSLLVSAWGSRPQPANSCFLVSSNHTRCLVRCGWDLLGTRRQTQAGPNQWLEGDHGTTLRVKVTKPCPGWRNKT